MKSYLLALTFTLLLVGCQSMPAKDSPIFVKYKYIVMSVPDDLLEIPPPTYKIDPATVTDRDTGVWMVDSERRAIELEKKLRKIREYLKIQQAEVAKLPEPDVVKR